MRSYILSMAATLAFASASAAQTTVLRGTGPDGGKGDNVGTEAPKPAAQKQVVRKAAASAASAHTGSKDSHAKTRKA